MEYFDVMVSIAKENHTKIIKKIQELSDNNHDLYLNLLSKSEIEERFKIIFLKTILYVWLKVPPNNDIT